MKTPLLLILLTLTLNSFSQVIENTPLIKTNGTATVYIEPDEVLLNYSIITEGDDLAQARKLNAQTSKRTIAYLKKEGVDPKHIQTRYLNVGIKYRNHNPKPQGKYYQASQSINVCIKDMDKYEEIMMGLLQLDIHNLSSPTFRTTEFRARMDEARNKAIVAAKEKATALAEELGQKIGTAYHIEEKNIQERWGGQNAYSNVAMDQSSESNDLEGGIAIGQLEIKASVDVSFHLLQ